MKKKKSHVKDCTSSFTDSITRDGTCITPTLPFNLPCFQILCLHSKKALKRSNKGGSCGMMTTQTTGISQDQVFTPQAPRRLLDLSACGSSDSEVTRTQKLVLRPVTVLCMQTTICWCWHTRAGKAWMKIRTECYSVSSGKKFTYVITNREVCTALTQGSGWQLQPLRSVQAATIYQELTWN